MKIIFKEYSQFLPSYPSFEKIEELLQSAKKLDENNNFVIKYDDVENLLNIMFYLGVIAGKRSLLLSLENDIDTKTKIHNYEKI